MTDHDQITVTAPRELPLSADTVLSRLSARMWQTAGQVADDLRQCGPLAFAGGDAEYRAFHLSSPKRQYDRVYRILLALRSAGRADCVLGDDKGNEVRVFRLFPDAGK